MLYCLLFHWSARKNWNYEIYLCAVGTLNYRLWKDQDCVECARSNSAISLALVEEEEEDFFGGQHRVAMFLQYVRGNSPSIPAGWRVPSSLSSPESSMNSSSLDEYNDDAMRVESSAVSIQEIVPLLPAQADEPVVDLAAGIVRSSKKRGSWMKWGWIGLGAGTLALSVGRRLARQRI